MRTPLAYPLVAVILCLSTVFAADVATVVDTPDTTQANTLYPGNRPPLLPSPLITLPFGAVKPRGWLRKQLELEADGFTAHLTEISEFCKKEGNAWLNPEGLGHSGWEEVPYWLRGYAALGFVLDNTNIITEAQPWIENLFASQVEYGYFGPNYNLGAPIHPAVPAAVFTTPDGAPGLKAEFFSDEEFKNLAGTRVDPNVDFMWPKDKPPMPGMPGEHYSVRWTGRITVKETGDYVFSLYSDDGTRLWIDGNLVVENWGEHSPSTVTAKKPVRLEAGKAHDLKLEFLQVINDADVRLGWKRRGCTYSPRIGGPDLMPNMNMLYVLRSYHEYTGDSRVLDLMTRYFRWQLAVPDSEFFSFSWQTARNGDNIDSIYWLYNRTGEPFLLDLAAKTERSGERWLGTHTGGHNVQFSQGFRKPAVFYQQNKDSNYLATAEGNWERTMGVYGQVPGGCFGGDEFTRNGYTDPHQAIETCGCVEMMLSEELLLRITGNSTWADRCENAAFNTLPATMTADLKALRYLTSPNQVNSDHRSKAPGLCNGGPQQLMNPFDHRCCQHNSGCAWPYFAQRTWYATPGNGLAAVFFAASSVKAKVGTGVTVSIEEETTYPFDGAVTFRIAPASSVRFPFYLRVPGWCMQPQAALNGRKLTVAPRPGSYIRIDREWKQGDILTLNLPMEVSIATWTSNKNSVSVNRGPLTFSVRIGEKYTRFEPGQFKDPWPVWEIVPTTPWNYALEFNPAKLAESFRVVEKPWPADNMPFTHAGTPLEIHATARKVPNWREDYLGLVDTLQQSPVRSTEPVETITMIPMGAARLRLSALPAIGTGPDAHEWQLPPEPLASYSREDDPYEAMFDGKVGLKSSDRSVPHFTTYGDQHGGLHWVRRNFDSERTVSSCEVYWYDESEPPGDVRLPQSWRVLYRCGKEWKEVENASGYGIEPDTFNVVTFKPVKTTALRLEIQCQPDRAMGIYEWKTPSP